MIVVTGGRASGKTAATIRWLLENIQRRCILVANRSERDHVLYRIQDFAKIKYDFRPHVISATDVQIGGFGRGRTHAFHFPEVAIDDATRVFKVLFGVDLDFMSVNATWIPLAPADTDVVKADVIEGKELPWSNPDHDVMGDIIEVKKQGRPGGQITGTAYINGPNGPERLYPND